MPKLPGRRLIPALAASLALLGCPPRVVGPDLAPVAADALLEAVAAAEARVERVRGEARLHARAKAGKTVVTVFAAAAPPGFVHLEQLDFFGRPQVVLATDGATFTLFDGQSGKWYRGPASARTVGRFFPVALAPVDLAALLLGRSPRLAASEPPTSTLDSERQCPKLTLSAPPRVQELWVSRPGDRVFRSSLRGPAPVDLEFLEWAEHGPALFPHRVTLDQGDGELHLELAWKDVEVNGAADPALFTLVPPEGAQVLDLDAQGFERPLAPDAGAALP